MVVYAKRHFRTGHGRQGLGEMLLPRHFLGMALIGPGLLFIEGRLPQKIAPRAAA
jgi:hypothetical protein